MSQLKKLLFPPTKNDAFLHTGLLLMRLVFGLSLGLVHGKNALVELLSGNKDYPDPLHMGSGVTKLLMGVFAEFFCALLVAAGLFFRLACLPIIIGFGIAVFIHHASEDFFAKNLSLLYLTGFATLLLTGPGRYSLDEKFFVIRRTRTKK